MTDDPFGDPQGEPEEAPPGGHAADPPNGPIGSRWEVVAADRLREAEPAVDDVTKAEAIFERLRAIQPDADPPTEADQPTEDEPEAGPTGDDLPAGGPVGDDVPAGESGQPDQGEGVGADPLGQLAEAGSRLRDAARRAIEALVLVTEQPLSTHLLGQLLEMSPAVVDELCRELAAEYEEQGRGFQLIEVAGGWRYQSHPDLAPYVERFVLEGQTSKLSAAALETLAIVAYKQPISRAQVAAIRGVSVDGVMRTLQQRGYISEIGKDPGPGQAVLFGTTPLFLEKLGLNHVDELPPLGDFVPGADVVEQLERGLRPDREPLRPEDAMGSPDGEGADPLAWLSEVEAETDGESDDGESDGSGEDDLGADVAGEDASGSTTDGDQAAEPSTGLDQWGGGLGRDGGSDPRTPWGDVRDGEDLGGHAAHEPGRRYDGGPAIGDFGVTGEAGGRHGDGINGTSHEPGDPHGEAPGAGAEA